MQRSCLLVAGVVALGCGGSGAPRRAAPPQSTATAPETQPATADPLTDAESHEVMGALIAIVQRLGAVAREPCADVAAAIDAELDANRETLALAPRLSPENRASAETVLLSVHDQNPPRGIGTARARCAATPAFARAFARLEALPGGEPALATTDAEIDAVVHESIAMSTRLGKATAGKDCAGVAAAIDAEVDHSAEYFARLARINTAANAERARARMTEKGYEAQMIDATTPFMNATMPCLDDEAVRAAMERMTRAMGGPYSERK
jgi:hypothetical protein